MLASPDVIAAVLAASGIAALVLGVLVMRGFGRGYGIGRTLRAAPEATLAQVEEAAKTGRRTYVRAHGRVSSEDDFPDEHDRPLVYRRRRVQLGAGAEWDSIDDRREVVPFRIAARGVAIGVDVDALGEGLVVLPRESRGTAGEVPGVAPAGTLPERPMRLLVEQVSAIEHAYVAGVPALDSSGRPMLTAGAGRPLIVCTLELPEAMRVLGGANRARAAGAAALLAAGCLLLVGALAVALVGTVHAADASPPPTGPLAVAGSSPASSGPAAAGGATPSPLAIAGGDTRSSGIPPSFDGQPILVALAVVALGALTAGASVLYVRLAQRR